MEENPESEKSGLRAGDGDIQFLPILTPEWESGSYEDIRELFGRNFKFAARNYAEAQDSERKKHAFSEMITYIHAALLKASRQTEKNEIWAMVGEIIGNEPCSALMKEYRRFSAARDIETDIAWLKVMGHLPPG